MSAENCLGTTLTYMSNFYWYLHFVAIVICQKYFWTIVISSKILLFVPSMMRCTLCSYDSLLTTHYKSYRCSISLSQYFVLLSKKKLFGFHKQLIYEASNQWHGTTKIVHSSSVSMSKQKLNMEISGDNETDIYVI